MKAFGLRPMTCSRCVNAVTTALNSADPGAKVEVDCPITRRCWRGGRDKRVHDVPACGVGAKT